MRFALGKLFCGNGSAWGCGCECERDGGEEEEGAGEALEHDAFAELAFFIAEPVADGPDDDDAPDAAGVIEDVGGGDFVEEGDAGGDPSGLEGEGATGGGGPFGVGGGEVVEGGFEERNEGEGEKGDGGEHGRREVAEAPLGDPDLLDDVGPCVGYGGEESEEQAWEHATAVSFSFSAEEHHRESG